MDLLFRFGSIRLSPEMDTIWSLLFCSSRYQMVMSGEYDQQDLEELEEGLENLKESADGSLRGLVLYLESRLCSEQGVSSQSMKKAVLYDPSRLLPLQ